MEFIVTPNARLSPYTKFIRFDDEMGVLRIYDYETIVRGNARVVIATPNELSEEFRDLVDEIDEMGIDHVNLDTVLYVFVYDNNLKIYIVFCHYEDFNIDDMMKVFAELVRFAQMLQYRARNYVVELPTVELARFEQLVVSVTLFPKGV